MSQPAEFDAIVVGGGPAGSAAATVLAQKGRSVALLERERFPRYKVGESLIPYCWFPLNRLGVVERLDASSCAVRKHSVQFVSTDGRVATPFYFSKHTDHPCSRTWQVVRSEFDQMLLENARGHGVAVFPETSARALLQERGVTLGVSADRADGTSLELRAPFTVDASGRDLFAARQAGWRVADETLKKLAIWTYYKGAVRDPGIDEGATTVAYVPEKGWFWYIPLPNDTVSVGIVAERDYLNRSHKGDLDAIFAREAEVNPWIRDHLAPGKKLAPCRITSDYSYRSQHCAADGLVLAGDAFAFLDPVFSSGVFLALQSGVMAADAIDAALADGDTSARRFEAYGESFRQGIEAMRRLVHAFYDTTFNFGTFLKAHPELAVDLTDCLIGNVYKDLEPLFEAVSEFAAIPEPLPHGRPLSSSALQASA